MEENSRLKKIIDLYVDKGLDDEYLHDEMVKAFANASPEEKKEGSKYLNWKLQEAKENGRDLKAEYPNKKGWILGFIVLIIVVVISIIVINNKDEQSNNSYNKNYTTNSSSSGSYYNTTNNSNYDNSIKHYCDASGCLNEGKYSLKRSDGTKEYYCYKHYKQMEEWAEMIMGY